MCNVHVTDWRLLLFNCLKREEKAFDPSVEALTQRVQELRNSITSFIVKLEQEHPVISWFVAYRFIDVDTVKYYCVCEYITHSHGSERLL